jgi:3-oxoadipate enol-lactonase
MKMEQAAARQTLHYQEANPEAANVLLLIHGFPLNSSMWQPQLDQPPDGWRVIAPDLRGYGQSPSLGSEVLTMDAAADDIAALLQSLGIRKAVICGLSMGGYIAFALLRRHLGLFRGLLLCDTRAAPDAEDVRAGRLESAAQVRTAGTAGFTDTMLPKLLSPYTRQRSPELEARVRAMMMEAPADVIAATLIGLAARPDSTPLLRSIAVPTQVVVGEDDQITPAGEAQLMARGIPGSMMQMVPDAGHLPNLENPPVFNRILAGFLMSVR